MVRANGDTGKTIKRDREALGLDAEILATIAGVKPERLRGYEAGTYSASADMHLELMLAIQTVEALLTAKPNGLDLSNAASLRNLVLGAYWGDFGIYARSLPEWKKTFKEMQERGEAASDHPPYLDPPAQSARPRK